MVRAVARNRRGRREWYLVPLFYSLVVAFLYREIWLGKVGIGWDLIESYWPDLSFFARELGRGNFPLWNPTERGGVPAHADPQNALFYPLQWLLAAWAIAIGETSWTIIQVKELFHHALAGTLLYLFCRTRKLPPLAALCAGLAMVLAETWVQLKSNNFLHAVAWTPLVWIATDAFFARPGARRAVALAAALYLPASVGSPPGYFYMLLTASLYGVYRAAEFVIVEVAARREGDAGMRRRALLRSLGRAAGGLALAAVLVAATQALLLLPVRDLLALSPRADRTVDFAVQGHSGPTKVWPALIAPLRDTYTAHCGLLTPVLCAVALLLRPRRDRGAPIFFAALGLFFLMLAFGPETPILRFLVINVPGFGLFRASARYLVPFPLAMGALAGYGMATLCEPRARLRERAALLGLIGLATIAVTVWLKRFEPELIFFAGWPQLPVLVAILLAAYIVAVALLPRDHAGTIAIAGIVLFYGIGEEVVRRDLGYHPRPDNLEDLAKVAKLDQLPESRIYDEFLLEQRAGSRLGLREFRGYPSEDPLSRLDYNEILAAATRPGGMPLLGEYNIRYVIYGAHSTKGWGRKRLPTFPDVAAPGRYKYLAPTIYEDRMAAPMIAWYGGVRRVKPAEVLPSLQAARDAKGVRKIAIVTEGSVPAALEPKVQALVTAAGAAPASVAGKLTQFGTETIDFEIDAPAAGVVVLNEFTFPGWQVYVDGRQEIPLTTDLALRGVLVDAGKHHVSWVYSPPRWPLLLGLWLAGMAAFLYVFVTALRARPSRTEAVPS